MSAVLKNIAGFGLLWLCVSAVTLGSFFLFDWTDAVEDWGFLFSGSFLATLCLLTYQSQDWNSPPRESDYSAIIGPRMIRKGVFVLSVLGLCLCLFFGLL